MVATMVGVNNVRKVILFIQIRVFSHNTITHRIISEDEALLEQKARVVGIGSVKYADLSMNRVSSYRFSFKKMLALAGNTAPYMLYAYARIEGIRRKAAQVVDSDGGSVGDSGGGGLAVSFADLQQEKEEMALAKHLIRFEEVLKEVEAELYPNKVTHSTLIVSYLCHIFSILHKIAQEGDLYVLTS